MEALGICKPAAVLLLVSAAGVIYHLLVGSYYTVMWWLLVGTLGTGLFQGLCMGGIEPVAWVLMMIPVLIVCFFLAVALFASRMRIDNFMKLPCDRCGHKHPGECCNRPKPCGCDRGNQEY